ncbi:hypothetical protein [Candidatus Tisiphia endosymbiont of Nemotelus uliginosus]|uniref:hypothetical protein n=1 Tax=Candidatus Tisiphia endosymbiont of Nemotelus uliginosus TaxID=3077926 RepID=UPI0035C89C03
MTKRKLEKPLLNLISTNIISQEEKKFFVRDGLEVLESYSRHPNINTLILSFKEYYGREAGLRLLEENIDILDEILDIGLIKHLTNGSLDISQVRLIVKEEMEDFRYRIVDNATLIDDAIACGMQQTLQNILQQEEKEANKQKITLGLKILTNQELTAPDIEYIRTLGVNEIIAHGHNLTWLHIAAKFKNTSIIP